MTAEVLRPNASSSAGMSLVDAATVHEALADDDDATYVTFDDLGAYMSLDFGTFALPAGARVKYSVLSLRGHSSGAPYEGVYVYTKIAGTPPGLIPLGTLYLYAGAAEIVNAAGVAWPAAYAESQTYIDAVFVELVGTAVGTFVMEAYLTIVYATQPTVDVTGPVGPVTTTTTPTVTWTHAPGSDGSGQSRSECRVFSAAQYGAAGFDPATSSATFETGTVYGSSPAAIVGPLADATTYRAYVRTAQTINGEPHWSEWAYQQFTTDFALPELDSLIVYPLNAVGRIELTVHRVVAAPTWETLTVERTADAGNTWQFVRGATDTADLHGPSWAGFDYEAPPGVDVVYRARSTAGEFTGPWVYSATTSWECADCTWLKDPLVPSRNVQVIINSQPQLTYPRRRGVHQVLGRSRPVTISDVRGSARGTVTLVTLDDDAADAIYEILSADVVLLQVPETDRFGSRYISIGDQVEPRAADLENIVERYWVLPFDEVDAPADSADWIDADQVATLLLTDTDEILTTDEGAALYTDGA